METLREAGVQSKKHLLELGREGDTIVEELLVGNALHVYSMVRRCIHFVNGVVRFLEEVEEGAGKGENGEIFFVT